MIQKRRVGIMLRIKALKQFFVIVWLFVGSLTIVLPLTVGSDTAVSRQSQPSFATQTDNIMLGFARFENGFAFADNKTSCTFDDFFAVAGTVNLAGGTLRLQQDLSLDNPIAFVNGGTIIGNSFSCELPRTLTEFTLLTPGGSSGFRRVDTNNAVGVVRVQSVDWNFNDNYIAIGSRVSASQELVIYYFDGTTLTNTKALEQGLDVNSVRWHPTLNYLATARASSAGVEMQIYDFKVSNGSLTLTSSADYVSNSARAVAWHPSGTFLTVGTTFNSKEIVTYTFNTTTGVATEKSVVNLSPDRDVSNNALSFSPGGNFLAIGVENSGSPELLIYSFSNGVLTLNSSVNILDDALAVDWSPTGTYIAVGADKSPQVSIYAHDPVANTLTLQTSITVAAANAVAWDKTGQYLAVGFLTITGPDIKVYYFNKTDLTLTDLGTMPAFADANTYATRWSRSGNYLATGDSGGNLTVYGVRRDDRLFFNNTKVILNSDVNLNVPMHFSGTSILSGRGNGLNFVSSGRIAVRPGSTLIIEDLELRNLGGTKLRCFTDAASITFKNSILNLSQDYTFSRGSILFTQDVAISGTNKFIYTTNLASTIDSNAMLYMGYGTTFSYAPQTAKKSLIVMSDATSMLYLDGSTLHVTRTGLQLSTGTLIIDDLVTFTSEARVPAEGISLKNDLTVSMRGGSNLQMFGIIRADS